MLQSRFVRIFQSLIVYWLRHQVLLFLERLELAYIRVVAQLLLGQVR